MDDEDCQDELDDEDLQARALALIEELEELTFDFPDRDLRFVESARARLDAGRAFTWLQVRRLESILDQTQ